MPYTSPEKKREWTRAYHERPEVKARLQKYQEQYRKKAKRQAHERAAIENEARKGKVRTIKCPHCSGRVPVPDNSTFVMNKARGVNSGDYCSNPSREYKRPETERRRQLAWYWKNREKVLAREKAKRLRVKALLVQQSL